MGGGDLHELSVLRWCTNRAKRSRVFALFATVFLLSAWALAEGRQTMISEQRVRLSDVAPDVPRGLAQVDLGRAPPPGRSRYFSYEEMAARLRSAGVSASQLKLPRGIRVKSVARQFTPEELTQLILAPVQKSMPVGVRLDKAVVTQSRVLSPKIEVGEVRLPRFVMKKGKQTQTGTVEILWGNQVALRLPVRMSVSIDERAAGQVVKRGMSVTLLIRRGSVEISALAQTLSTGRVGDVVSVRVGVTKKVMAARLVSHDRAELEI